MTQNQAQNSPRRLRRFFSDLTLPSQGQEVRLSQNQTHHMAHVHRLGPGERCCILDGSGDMVEAVIIRFSEVGEAVLRIEGSKKRSAPFPLKLKIHAAIPQRCKFDTLVEKAQELGVDELHPLETQRTVVKIARETQPKVLDRWLRIAREAAKQSYSLRLIKLFTPVSFKKALKQVEPGELVAFFHPDEDAVSFPEFYEILRQKVKAHGDVPNGVSEGLPVNIFIGPEGGFTDEEVREIMQCPQVFKVNLGDTVLKVDTAFYGIASSLRFLFSE